MNRIAWIATLLSVTYLLAAHERVASAATTVELTVRGPGGELLKNQEIAVVDHPEFPGKDSPSSGFKTNDRGVARFDWLAGTPSLRVTVAGIGYGSTGIFHLPIDETARPSLPRLAPFCIVEGTVAKELRKPDVVVTANAGDWLATTALVDKQGHFVLKDAPCGGYWVRIHSRSDEKLWGEAPVFVEPGERIQVKIAASEKPAPIPFMPPTGPRGKGRKSLVWAEGTVRDQAGQPVEGAQVIGRAVYSGGMRDYDTTHSALTDANGHYQIAGETGLSMFRGALLAYKVGHPFVITPSRDPYDEQPTDEAQPQDARASQPQNPVYDFVLPSDAGAMEVRVTRDNKPLADANVTVSPGAVPYLYGVGSGGDAVAARRWERILHPVSVTNPDGIARFQDLSPGVYTIEVAVRDDKNPKRGYSHRWAMDSENDTKYEGVVVEEGKTKKFHATYVAQHFAPAIKLLRADGKPAANSQLEIEWSKVGERSGRRSGAKTDADGLTSVYLHGLGLWSLSYTENHSGWIGKGPSLFEPYYEASAVVAASPLLPHDHPLTLRVTPRQRVPGSLIVQLQDAAGKPAAGHVVVDRWMLEPNYAGSTDDRGEIRFEGIIPRMPEVDVEAYLPGLRLPAFGEPGDPFPADTELLGRVAIFSEEVNCPYNAETRLTIRPRPVGYARGVVRPAAGMTAADYWVGSDYSRSYLPKMSSRYDERTGEFAIGPLVEGKVNLRLRCRGANKRWRDCATKEVEVHVDRVTHMEIVAPVPPPENKDVLKSPQYISIGVGGASVLGQLSRKVDGIVVLPDGKSPARQVQVAMFVPSTAQAVAHDTTDSGGHFSLVGAMRSLNQADQNEGHAPSEPLIAAWLPGRFGPAIVPALRAEGNGGLRIVLPKSLALSGRITIGGKEFTERQNEVSVAIVREGNEVLNALSREVVSADTEGGFELRGLTSGDYILQASLDSIWLSQSARITIKNNSPPKLVTLDIAEPGSTSTVTLVDQQGHAAPGMAVMVVRPVGPLAGTLWPATLFSDAAGIVNVPPLEAGKHKLRVKGLATEQILTVSPLGESNAAQATQRITVAIP